MNINSSAIRRLGTTYACNQASHVITSTSNTFSDISIFLTAVCSKRYGEKNTMKLPCMVWLSKWQCNKAERSQFNDIFPDQHSRLNVSELNGEGLYLSGSL